MKIGGWKTHTMFSRYNVVNSDRIRKAMEKGGKYMARRAVESRGWYNHRTRGDMVQGLARGPFKAKIRVRIPVSLPVFSLYWFLH
jgi:hypothetical protein